ncbi:hypothetical protein O181_031453 [Austropuccinia psidii MF-1]|uniref:DDE Tnp4 domain-containing protein n=1 Tax=Austropuccinia psidii MF-1 TaxID=1389203 RepID=A0A9Q3H4L9_9BASI|nr:hypothetical protein [Austropuccinia psidii MF-1]
MSCWPGSCANSSLYKEMGLHVNHNFILIKVRQYLIGDSAYPLNINLIPPFKAPQANHNINKEFNYCLAQSQVFNEHTIGILKGRWASLRGMRLQLDEIAHKRYHNQWITAWCVLHNMLMQVKDSWKDLALQEQNTRPDVLIPEELDSVQESHNLIRD